jgi:hypothetical protein
MNPYDILSEPGHEGKFTAQFKARKPHLRHLKSLEEFANYILANPTEFNKISKQRANYYRNLIEKKGGMFKNPINDKKMKITKKCEAMYGGQMTRDLYNYHRQIGGKMSVSQFQKFLTNSYSKTPEQKIDDYEYDPELSIDRAKVYHDPKTGQAVITHTGTDSATDWLNNLAIATNTYKYTTRYKNAKKAQEATERKYGKQNVSSLGHSQGARLAEKISSDKNKEILTLNKATNPFESYHHKNQTDVRSSGDIVSRLNPFNWGKNKEIIIPKQSNDIIKEHSPNVLNRINPNMIIGEGRRNKKLRRLCNCCGAKCPYCR